MKEETGNEVTQDFGCSVGFAGTAFAIAQSSSTVGTGGTSAGGGMSSSSVGTGGSSAGGSGSGSASTLGTGGTSAGGGTSSSSVGTGGSAAGSGSGSASTLGTGGTSAGGGKSSSSVGTGGSAAGSGKNGSASTVGTGGSSAGDGKSGSTVGAAGSNASSMGMEKGKATIRTRTNRIGGRHAAVPRSFHREEMQMTKAREISSCVCGGRCLEWDGLRGDCREDRQDTVGRHLQGHRRKACRMEASLLLVLHQPPEAIVAQDRFQAAAPQAALR